MIEPRKLDPAKPVRTRDGRPARILAADLQDRHGWSIVSAVRAGPDHEIACMHMADGRSTSYGGERDLDLVNVVEKREAWVNVYPAAAGRSVCAFGYVSKRDADCAALKACVNRIACVRVEFEEGEGL